MNRDDERDNLWRRDEIDSPCVKICAIHPEARLCIGCHRTIEEIASWSRLTADQRIAIMAELPSRAGRLRRRRGGRAGRMATGEDDQ